jgi:adenosylcobinamide-GDP ribazoletransferase
VGFAVLSLGLPEGPVTPLAAAIGSTNATVALTGALHEKGLAAFGGESPALTLALLAKVALLGVLAYRSPGALATALIAAHTVSRFWPLVMVQTLQVAGSEAPTTAARPLAARIERRALGVAAAWCLVPLALMVLAHGVMFTLLALAASALALWAMRYLAQRRLQGYSADALGAAQQVCEIAFYLGAAFGLSSR